MQCICQIFSKLSCKPNYFITKELDKDFSVHIAHQSYFSFMERLLEGRITGRPVAIIRLGSFSHHNTVYNPYPLSFRVYYF